MRVRKERIIFLPAEVIDELFPVRQDITEEEATDKYIRINVFHNKYCNGGKCIDEIKDERFVDHRIYKIVIDGKEISDGWKREKNRIIWSAKCNHPVNGYTVVLHPRIYDLDTGVVVNRVLKVAKKILSEKEFLYFYKYYFENKTIREIKDEIEMKSYFRGAFSPAVSTIKSYISIARKKLRKYFLKGGGFNC